MFENDDFVMELMLNYGLVTEEQIETAKETCSYDDSKVIDTLISSEVTDEEGILMLLSSEYSMEYFDLEDYEIPQDVIDCTPADIVKRYQVLPVMKTDFSVTVAMVDPTNIETLDNLRYILKTDIDGVVAPRKQVLDKISHHYGGLEDAIDTFIDGMDGEMDIEAVIHSENDDGEISKDDAPIIRLVTMIIVEAYRTKASDIHLEPMERRFRVRYRVDGVLKEVENPPKYLQNNVLSRLKIMAGLKITEKRVPQDGRIAIMVLGKPIDLRVSTVPTTHGESIVMRILDKESIQLGIPELGFFSDDQEIIDRVINLPDGIFLVTGPTGSGKTTSLYAFLNTINEPTRKIITAEDPIEYDLAGINQVQIDNSIGMSFPAALRSMLRQAPNIIMVGEIRDLETGAVAINAALTGHMVFSTLHTNDAPGAITRLIDMGVQPFLVASSLRAVMAQRLVRKICKECAQPYTATVDELRILRVDENFFANATLMKGAGCPSCNKGFKGRMGAFEMFEMNDSIRELIYDKASSAMIKTRCRELGMRSLRDDALRKAAAGMTTLSEVVRFTVIDEGEV